MIRAIALRLEGPMQSWGAAAAGDDRPTLDFPTKSGVLGLVAGALGIDRREVDSLAALHRGLSLAIRVDRPGTRGLDFHTVEEVPTAEGKTRKDPVVSRRAYLYDASFVALLAERGTLTVPLETLLHALRYPRFAPYLGRRSCPPAVSVLAARDLLAGPTWDDLFSRIEPARAATHQDFYLESAGDEKPLRWLRVRDELRGPLPRMFAERMVAHFVCARRSLERNTVDPWFPT